MAPSKRARAAPRDAAGDPRNPERFGGQLDAKNTPQRREVKGGHPVLGSSALGTWLALLAGLDPSFAASLIAMAAGGSP